jgi:hypothetical protein
MVCRWIDPGLLRRSDAPFGIREETRYPLARYFLLLLDSPLLVTDGVLANMAR